MHPIHPSINTSKRYSLYLQNNYGLIVGCIYIFNMSTSTHNPKALVIEKPSKALVDFMNKLRDRNFNIYKFWFPGRIPHHIISI